MNFTRRTFIKTFAAGTTLFTFGCVRKVNSEVTRRVVVLGGGYGGSAAAKYLKMLDQTLDVILIDRNSAHISCALSNEVMVGKRDISFITLPHKAIADKYGVNFVQAEIESLDAKKKIVQTSAGGFPYDKLIVSPGIGLDYDEAAGFDREMQNAVPHAWIAGPQTVWMRDALKNIKKGGTILIRTPKPPYRCPPGPYERSCLISELVKTRDCKVTVIDPNPQIVSKAPLFQAAFSELYKDVLTYIPGVTAQAFDKGKRAIVTDKGTFTADLINFVPEQKAGELAFALGLVPEGMKWAAVNPATFESKVFSDVYVIGDAIDPSVTETPKSGVVANGAAKLVAENIVRDFAGLEPVPVILGNSCYSLVSSNEGIYVATVYKYDAEKGKIVIKNGANSIPPSRTEENRRNMESWAENMLSDTFK